MKEHNPYYMPHLSHLYIQRDLYNHSNLVVSAREEASTYPDRGYCLVSAVVYFHQKGSFHLVCVCSHMHVCMHA